MGGDFILSIDEGTTSTRAMIFDKTARVRGVASREFKQYFPKGGWVEHDPNEIWECTLASVEEALIRAGIGVGELAAIGITNQRETSVFWERETLEPVGRAIVWQCRRSAEICERLKMQGSEPVFRERTGLLLDPYFSGTKITWKMENDPVFARRAPTGEIAFGTIDSWLLAKLTGGAVHSTDITNASRTLLFDINRLCWSEHLASELEVPMVLLPEVKPSCGDFGTTDPSVFLGASIPISGVAGDQQSALFGQCCYRPGMTKNSYGTGGFLLMNTGSVPVSSMEGLLTTIAWGIGEQVTYALEGSIFVSGAAIQWLRDGLGIIRDASETGPAAERAGDSGGVYFVPAFVGLGAPYWDPYARGAIFGLTRGSTREHLIRATMESMAFQTRDVLEAMEGDSGLSLEVLRVDGGASAMDILIQFQADLLGIPVQRPHQRETTALGAAFLAGLGVGLWDSTETLEELWHEDLSVLPSMDREEAERLYNGWKRAVARVRGWGDQ